MTYTSSIDAPRGRLTVATGDSLRAVIYGLIVGHHWWRYDAILREEAYDEGLRQEAAKPRTPGELRALQSAMSEDEHDSHWVPNVEINDDGILWRTWGPSTYPDRYIRLGYDGSVEWDTGHGRASTFVASVLVALGVDPAGTLIPATLESQPREVWTLDGDRVRIAEALGVSVGDAAHGCRAEWTGDGDTWGDGSDARVEPAWPDLSPSVAIGGNAVEDTAALYDGDGTNPARERADQ